MHYHVSLNVQGTIYNNIWLSKYGQNKTTSLLNEWRLFCFRLKINWTKSETDQGFGSWHENFSFKIKEYANTL